MLIVQIYALWRFQRNFYFSLFIYYASYVRFVSFQQSLYSLLACDQALRGALVAGREKEGELATTSLKFEFQFLCGSPFTELSDFRQSARSGNERECKQTLKNTCQGSWRHYRYHLRQSAFRIVFRCRYSNSRDAVASSPSFSRPTARAPPRACSQANSLCVSIAKSKTTVTICWVL